MTFKKFISILTVISILAAFVPDRKVLAEDVTILNTIGDVLYDYTSDDLLSTDNYNDYYDLVNNGLKYCVPINQHYVNNTNTSYLPSNLWNLVSNAFNDSSFKNISFHPDTPEDSLKLILFFVGPSYSNLLELVSIVPQGNISIVDGHLISDQPYTIYWVDYSFSINTTNEQYVINTNPYIYGGDYKHINTNNTVSSNGLYESNYNNPSYFLYSDIPFYFTYSANNQYSDMAYLGQSPYNYQNYINVYNAISNDTTGFVIDRRTSKMMDINNNNNEIIQDGFDPKLFNGELGFNSFNASASLNYNSTTDLYEPFFDIKYQPNNYTEINIEDITLYYQAEVFLKLTLSKNMTSFYYTSTRYKTSGQGSLDRSGTSPNANRYEFILYAMNNPPLGNALWNNTSTRSSAGINTQFGISTFTGNNIDYDISVGVSAFKHNNYVVVPSESEALEMINDYLNGKNGNVENKSYGYYKIQLYIKNNVTGDISTTYSSIFDLFGNKISDNSSSMINNDDQEYNDFVNDFYYLDKDGDLTPVDYADRINSYGGNSSVGDITIYQNPYPYVLVDIPENEWMSYTPNLRTLLTEFKTMLAEVHDESVLKMLPETYNYLPAPFMNYMLYGVGLIVMIGIWRAITRR